MTTWLLILLLGAEGGFYVRHEATFMTEQDCLRARELLIEQKCKPVVNYQLTCLGVSQGQGT